MATKWNASIMWPTDTDFINRITDVTFGPSNNSGNPQFTIEWEVVAPNEKMVGGVELATAGVKTKTYMATQVLDGKGGVDSTKTAQALGRLTGQEGLLTMAFPENPEFVTGFNPQNPSQETMDALKGLCFYTEMGPDIEERRKNPTPEQIEKAKAARTRAEGDIMKNPVTGKPLVNYWPKIRNIFGLAPSSVGANKPY